MPMPLPSEQRSPIVITGSPWRSACEGIPALIVASGPIRVPSPISMRCSPYTTVGGNAIIDPSPKCANRRARRWRGPNAPTCTTPVHAACTTSPSTRLTSSRITRERYFPPMPNVIPIRIGLLYDFPQGDGLFAESLRLGLDEVAESGRLDREIELVDEQARGLPSGSEHDITRAFAKVVDEGAVAIIGPSISDNALIAAPLCDAARIPAINYSGGERTRSQWMFHYQVGSLEEEPPVLAQRMVERGLRRAAVVFDQSPVGRRYAECFEA